MLPILISSLFAQMPGEEMLPWILLMLSFKVFTRQRQRLRQSSLMVKWSKLPWEDISIFQWSHLSFGRPLL